MLWLQATAHRCERESCRHVEVGLPDVGVAAVGAGDLCSSRGTLSLAYLQEVSVLMISAEDRPDVSGGQALAEWLVVPLSSFIETEQNH